MRTMGAERKAGNGREKIDEIDTLKNHELVGVT
jgi:hypothetical protein